MNCKSLPCSTKYRRYFYAVVGIAAVVAAVLWAKHDKSLPTTMLSARIGETYDDVIKESTYPVAENSAPPDDKPYYDGSTQISGSDVVIVFNDPVYGVTLPPTQFGKVVYADRKVEVIAASLTFNPLPFDKAIALLNRLQADFKKAGWKPSKNFGEQPSTWFDTQSAAELTKLRIGGGLELVAGDRYLMFFYLSCQNKCLPKPSVKSRYDIGLGISDLRALNMKQQ